MMMMMTTMKRLFPILLLLVAVNAYAGDFLRDTEPAILEVHYTRTEVTDTTKRATNFFIEETMLRIGNNMSRYCSVPKYYQDSLYHFNRALYFEMERIAFESCDDPVQRDARTMERHGRYWDVIYKNYPVGKLTVTSYFETTDWKYEEDWEKPLWEIGDSSKTILGYDCVQATARYRGREWTAWFAPDIPVQDGPWKLCGLPGLILEASDSRHEFHFIANGLRQSSLPDVGFLCYNERSGVTDVSRDKFFNNWWRYTNSNFAAKMSALHGKGPSPSDNRNHITHHDKEETDYPHDL